MTTPIPIQLLIITLFERDFSDENLATENVSGEFCLWQRDLFASAEKFSVRGAFSPVFVARDSVAKNGYTAGMITGIGKANAASSLAAVLSDPRFDFSHAYFLVAGCAGISPNFGTTGDVIIADISIDLDLTYRWEDEFGEHATRSGPYALPKEIVLPPELVKAAKIATASVILEKNDAANACCRRYPQAEANAEPTVKIAATATSDAYWHGQKKSAQAASLCAELGGKYGATQMEDHAIALTLNKFGFADRLLIVRGAVNFDQPFPGESIAESLNDSSPQEFQNGIINTYRVASAIAAYLVAHEKRVSVNFR